MAKCVAEVVAQDAKSPSKRRKVQDDDFWDEQSRHRWDRPGSSTKEVEPASMVYQHAGGGRLLLAGLPTQKQREVLEKCSLIVTCFAKPAEEVWIREQGSKVFGWIPTAARRLQWEVTHERRRDEQWKAVALEICSTLRQGENALVHCRAGIHRAALGTAKLLAWLDDVPLEQAVERIQSARAVDLESVLQQSGNGAWARGYDGLKRPEEVPRIAAWAKAKNGRYAHAMAGPPSAREPLCKWRKSKSAAKELFKSGIEESSDLEGLAANLKGICRDCGVHMAASQRKLALELFGDKALG